jgi:hypothetical protein
VFEMPRNKIKEPVFTRKSIDLNVILSEQLDSLKFLAAFKVPVAISFWDKYAQVGEENLSKLMTDYELLKSEDGKIIPIEIPTADLKPQNLIIAKDQLELWKNRKK